ncbi:hypothetical protein SteCoe_19603 [Stentor coeruleus]|uniref:Protein kinase domain-containing protein n=1 Tax=Stentor coeruleus TaxID=5963 RepID=A0A1R2BU51_9CILI|nr:hypothetical protein SteCoe_19603 [Stentor coeruleus]
MGCNKSLPVQAPTRVSSEPEVYRRRPAQKKTSLITKEMGSLSNHFEILSAMGSTSTGTLLSARDLRSGTLRTIREVSKTIASDHTNLFLEVTILSELDHPNILKVYQTIETNRSYYVVMESADGGNVQDRILKSGNEYLVGKFMQDIFSAVNYMHIKGIIHCDLHIGNLLLSNQTSDAVPKVVGFTFSQKSSDMQEIDLALLNYQYISPDMLDGTVNEKTDIWSLGIILYKLLVGKLPFASKNKKDILEAIYKADLDFEDPNFVNLSHNAKDLLQKLLVRDSFNRLSAKDALNHVWLQQTNKDVGLSYEIVQKLRRFKIKTNIVRSMLSFLNFKLDFKEHEIIGLFKKMDVNHDGNIAKDEMTESFKSIGIDCANEIDSIMNNLDMDQSGSLDFTELKIVLINWDKEIKKKLLGKVFEANEDGIDYEMFKHVLHEILPSEWTEFAKKVKVENNRISLPRLKEYLKANLVF